MSKSTQLFMEMETVNCKMWNYALNFCSTDALWDMEPIRLLLLLSHVYEGWFIFFIFFAQACKP